MWAWSAPGFNAWGIKSLLKICTANDSLNCISSVCCFMGYVFQSPWKVFCVILILSPEELEGSALLARSMSQSSRVMVLMEDGIFAWGVVNIKAPSDDPAKCLDPGKGQQIAPPCEIPAADAPRPIVSQLCQLVGDNGCQWLPIQRCHIMLPVPVWFHSNPHQPTSINPLITGSCPCKLLWWGTSPWFDAGKSQPADAFSNSTQCWKKAFQSPASVIHRQADDCWRGNRWQLGPGHYLGFFGEHFQSNTFPGPSQLPLRPYHHHLSWQVGISKTCNRSSLISCCNITISSLPLIHYIPPKRLDL